MNSHSRTGSANNNVFMTQFLNHNTKPINTSRDPYPMGMSQQTSQHSNSSLQQALVLNNNTTNTTRSVNREGSSQNNLKMKSHMPTAGVGQGQLHLIKQQSAGSTNRDKNYSTTDLHKIQGLQSNFYLQKTFVNTQMSPNGQQSNLINFGTSNGLVNPDIVGDMKNDNIQKAIDNLKHFIKGSFPKNNTLQCSKQAFQQANKHPMNRPQALPGLNHSLKPREHSEDPRAQLAASFFQRQQQLSGTQQSLFSEQNQEEIDVDESFIRKNPHVPIPAFTSEDIKKKLRYRSEDRYVNDRMEKELQQYKQEIEKRFQKSSLKDFTYPRLAQTNPTQQPLFFSTMMETIREKPMIADPQQHQPNHSRNRTKNTSVHNKENIVNNEYRYNANLNIASSPTSPYGYKGQQQLQQQFQQQSKQGGGSYTMCDYKKILSQFLSSSIGIAHQQNQIQQSRQLQKEHKQQMTLSQNSQQHSTANPSNLTHQRSQSSGLHHSNSMMSQRLLANAQQNLKDQINKARPNKSQICNQPKKNTQTFVEQHSKGKQGGTDGLNSFIKQALESKNHESNADGEYIPITCEDLMVCDEGFDDHQPNYLKAREHLTSSQLKTFDYSSHQQTVNSNNKSSSLVGYLSNGAITMINQKVSRKDASDQVSKKHSKDVTSGERKGTAPQTKEQKASDYFKTFYQSSGQNQTKRSQKSAKGSDKTHPRTTLNSMVNNNFGTTGNHSSQVSENPFSSSSLSAAVQFNQLISSNQNSHTLQNSQNKTTSQGKVTANASITQQIQQQQQHQNQQQNPFQLQVNLKAIVQESNLKMGTRNNKLSSGGGTGMHIRAKTTADFDQYATISASSQVTKQKNLQQIPSGELRQSELSMGSSAGCYNQSQYTNGSSSTLAECQTSLQKSNPYSTSGKTTACLSAKQSAVIGKKKEGKKNKAQAVKESADLKQIKSLKVSKNVQDQRQQQILATNGPNSDRLNPYNNYQKQIAPQQQMYSHREQPSQQTKKRDITSAPQGTFNGLASIGATTSISRASCPYSDPQVKSQGYQSNTAYDSTGAGSLKNIFSSFQTQTMSAKPSSKKRQPKVADLTNTTSSAMVRTNSKRDFKVKCMKIDLSKQLEYCNTETSQ